MQGATLSILGLYNYDPNLFSQMSIPVSVDRQTLVDLILADCAELEVIYTDPQFFKRILESWSRSRLPVWERLEKAINAEYNVVENYDRSEEWTDTGSGTSLQKNRNRGYNQGAGMLDATETDSSGENTNTHSGRVHGNIGVVSGQDLVEQEIALAPKTDLYNYIVGDVRDRFCIPVW
jgi:hypothetical protein